MRSSHANSVLDPVFVRQVYDIVAKIPVGKVATYGQIAKKAGNPSAARDVGYIMSHISAGHGLPCHRVVNRTGTLAPEYAFGGQEKQRAILEAEGVTFFPDGRIDMIQHQWSENQQLTLFS